MDSSEWKLLLLFTLLPTTACTLVANHDNQGLTVFPAALPSGVTTLRVSNNQIANVPSGSLAGQSSLGTMYMLSNLLTSFPDICDVGTSLQKLYLASNTITTTDEALLCCLTSVTLLSMPGNGMTSFPNVACLVTLRTLDLSGNAFVQVVDSVLEPLVQLSSLDLTNCNLNDTMVKTMKAPPNVVEVLLLINYLTDLPDWDVCPGVTSLNMRNNRIEHISEKSVQTFPNVVVLDLEKNPLKSLPANMSFTFQNLITLVINKASSLQNLTCDFLETMPGLVRLEAKFSQISTWNCELNQPHFNLRAILLDGSDITNLPKNLSMLKALATLALTNNPTEKYPDLGKDLGNTLITLELSGHGNIPDNALSGHFAALKTIAIKHNHALTKFPKLGQMPVLTAITIMYTSLVHIPCATLPYLPELTILSLYNNDIVSVPDIRFKLPKWTTTRLYNNRIVCDCDMQWLQGSIQQAGSSKICIGFPTVPFAEIDFNSLGCTLESGFQGYGTKIPFSEAIATSYEPLFREILTRNKIECAALCQQDDNCHGWKTIAIPHERSKRCQMYTNDCVADDTPTNQYASPGVSTKTFVKLD